MNKKLLIILDPAHGEETPGKRSPDGEHREYRWSRERLNQIETLLIAMGYTVVWTNETNREVGLSNRKNIANRLASEHPTLTPFLISLHNDAAKDDGTWQNTASGISVWTSKGRTASDLLANIFIDNVPEWLPKVRQRTYDRTPGDKDFEANFTVLMGNYSAILIECMFQDNKNDVYILQDKRFQKQVEDWIADSVELCNRYLIEKTK